MSSTTRTDARRRRSSAILVVALAGLGAVALAVWLLLERGPEPAPANLAARASPAEVGGGDVLVRRDPPVPELVHARVPLERDPSADAAGPAVETAVGTVTGILSIDGAIPEGGRVVLRSADGKFERSSELDRFGRFAFEAVPVIELNLACAVADLGAGGTEPRRLVPPRVDVLPEAGARRHLDLEWITKHVNVRVISDDPAGNQARVEVEGPATSASFETDGKGKAKLSLVGNGRFLFRAVQPSGRCGEAALDLEEDVELDSVVIATTLRQ